MASGDQTLKQFKAGELVFYPTRVELCSVKICDGMESGLRRKVLEVLKCKRSNGNFLSLSGDELRERVDAADVNSIAAVVRKLRQDIVKRLKEIGIECGWEDVLLSGGPGYRFAESISIRESKVDCRPVDNESNSVVEKPCIANRTENDRLEWILTELRAGKGLRIGTITEKFDCSQRTAKRDIEFLRRSYNIAFDGSQKTGQYRLVQSRKSDGSFD